MAGGRFNSETESNYAPLEGELLGIASALHKSRYFTSGQRISQSSPTTSPYAICSTTSLGKSTTKGYQT